MTQISRVHQNGYVKGWMIATIGLIVLSAGLAIFSVWAFINYTQQKKDVDTRIESAVSLAQINQVNIDEAKFTERDKQPNLQFVGPDDYGRVTFNYPKTWSVYVNEDASDGGTYEAYLNPVTVPPVSSTQQFALRVLIEQKDYDQDITSYNSLVQEGKLKASSVTEDGVIGTRLDGNFTDDIRGSAVIFKIRDTTLTIRTDADTFDADFNALISTIKFNQ